MEMKLCFSCYQKCILDWLFMLISFCYSCIVALSIAEWVATSKKNAALIIWPVTNL